MDYEPQGEILTSYDTLEPVVVPFSQLLVKEAHFFNDAMDSREFAETLKDLNEYFKKDPYNKQKFVFPGCMIEHFWDRDPKTTKVVLTYLGRLNGHAQGVKTQNYVMGLLPARVTDQGLVFERIIYYKKNDAVNPKEDNFGFDPYVPISVVPFDTKNFAPAYFMKKLSGNMDGEHVSHLVGYLIPFFEIFMKTKAVTEWGHYVTKTSFRLTKLLLPCMLNNPGSLKAVSGFGLVDYNDIGGITLEGMQLLNRKGKMLIEILEGALEKSEPRPKKKRRGLRGQQDVELEDAEGSEAEQEEQDEPDVESEEEEEEEQNAFSAYLDGNAIFPDLNEIFEKWEKSDKGPQANQDGGKPDPSNVYFIKEDPIKWYLEENVNIDVVGKLSHDASQAIAQLLINMISKSRNWSELMQSHNMEVVWNPKTTEIMTDNAKLQLQKAWDCVALLTTIYGPKTIILTRFLKTFEHERMSFIKAVGDLINSDSFNNDVYRFLFRIFNQDVINRFKEQGDMCSLSFSLVHAFMDGLTVKANIEYERFLSLKGLQIERMSGFPERKDLIVSKIYPDQEDQLVKRQIQDMKALLEKIDYRLSQQETTVESSGASFVVVRTHDPDVSTGFCVVVEKLWLPVPERVFGKEAIVFKDQVFQWQISTETGGEYNRIFNLCSEIISTCQDCMHPARALLRLKMVDSLHSLLRNLIDGHFIRELFDWPDGAEELLSVIKNNNENFNSARLTAEDQKEVPDDLVTCLKAIGNTDFLKKRFSMFNYAELRALALAYIMPVFMVSDDDDDDDGNDKIVEMSHIANFVFVKGEFTLNPRWFHNTPKDLKIRDDEKEHYMSEHVKYTIFGDDE